MALSTISTIFSIQSKTQKTLVGIWIVLGRLNNTLGYSYDGINFTGLGNLLFTHTGFDAVSNGSIIVAGGQGLNGLSYSYDGLNYTGLGESILGICLCVEWSTPLNMFVAGGTSGETGNTLAHSSDGINWTGLGNPVLTTNVRCVAWGNNRFVALGQGASHNIAYSLNGIDRIGVTGFGIFQLEG